MTIMDSNETLAAAGIAAGPDDIMTINEVADYLKIPRETIYKYVRSKRIPASKLGRHWRFSRTEVDAWRAKKSNEGKRPLNVLIVDDEDAVRTLFCRWMNDAGCETVATSNGREALRMLQTAKFDLVLLDLMMPTLNGADVLKEIRKLAPRTAVVVVTGYHDGKLMDEALETGMITTLKKPVTKEGLLETRKLCPAF